MSKQSLILAQQRSNFHASIAVCDGNSCQVFVGPNMQNFEDVVEQIDAMQAQQADASPQTSSLESHSAIHSVKDAFELTKALEKHFQSSEAASTRSLRSQEMMQTLAVRSLRSHERKLLEWLTMHVNSNN